MPSAKVSIAWAPGERLMASCGEGPNSRFDPLDSLSRPFLTLFYQSHVHFEFSTVPVLQSSSNYRASLLDCYQNLIAEETFQVDQGADEEANCAGLSVDMVRDGHCVWKFAEAVYLSDQDDVRHVSLRLSEWYMECFPHLNTRARQLLKSISADNFNEGEFWDVLTELVSAGSRALALDIIKARAQGEDTEQWADAAGAAAMGVITKSEITPLAIAESILRECPGDVSAARKDGRWNRWQNHCMDWSLSEEMSNNIRMKRFLGILGGNIPDLAAGCQDWPHMLVACCTYGRAQPGIVQSRVSSDAVAIACGEASAAFPPPRHIAGGALTEAAMGNPAGMIINLSCSLSTTWFAAHLCDLLVQANIISEEGPREWTMANGEVGIREFYLKEYAASLERHRGMWRLAAAYYLQCPTVGPSHLASMLSRVVFDGPADPSVEKVLRLCGQQHWTNAARSICEKIGSDCLQSGNYGGALAWFARGSLRHRAHEVANEALQNAEMQGPGSPASRSLECVVAALATTKDTSLPQTLDFLRVYSEFQSAIFQCREIRATEQPDIAAYLERRSFALDAILRLIGSGGLPRKHWAVALREVGGLVGALSPEIPIVSMHVVQELLSGLQLVTGPYRSPEMLRGLQRRIFFEISGSSNVEEIEGTIDIKDVEKSLANARKIFVSAVGRGALQ